MDKLFISSVGTGIGKTLVTSVLCDQLRRAGRTVAAIKPIVSGFRDDDCESDPAVILRALGKSCTQEAIAEISPWRFPQPVSPHLAARAEGVGPSLRDMAAFCRHCEIASRSRRSSCPMQPHSTGSLVVLPAIKTIRMGKATSSQPRHTTSPRPDPTDE